MRRPAQDAGGWVMLGLVSQWLPLCESSLGLSSGVQGLGVSAPTPGAQGLISGQEQRVHKSFVPASRESKTDIQK